MFVTGLHAVWFGNNLMKRIQNLTKQIGNSENWQNWTCQCSIPRFSFSLLSNVVCLRILNHSNQCCPLLWNIMNSTSNRPLKAGHIWVVVLLGLSNTEWFYRRQGHTTFEALCWLLQWWKADYRSHNLEVMENFFLLKLT